jgi:hypothetical protein
MSGERRFLPIFRGFVSSEQARAQIATSCGFLNVSRIGILTMTSLFQE